MRKGIKTVLILSAVFLLLGIALCIISFSMGADPVKLLTDGTYTISINKPIGHLFDPDTYDDDRDGSFGQRPGPFGEAVEEGENTYSVSGDIKNLEIEWVSGNVKIIRGEGKNITFSESDPDGIDTDDRLYYTIDGNTLKIECCDSGKIQIGININGGCGNKELVLMIPQDMLLMDINVDTTSADVEMAGIVAERDIIVCTTSGDLNISETGCEAAFLDSTSGKLDFSGASREVHANTISGKIAFSGDCNEFEADSTSGKVEAAFSHMPDELDIETVSGAVRLDLPGDAAFKLEYDTVSGSMDCEFPVIMYDGAYFVNDGGTEIDVDTTSGNLKIY